MQPNPEYDPWLTPQEAARVIGISYKTLNNLADQGRIAFRRRGGTGRREYRYSVARRFRDQADMAIAREVERNHPSGTDEEDQ